ncbi:MAG: cyanophycinase, partial [Planctomycetaceae bacterium]|nr:cyanophycinase [Planctomycetaceae bacterium]
MFCIERNGSPPLPTVSILLGLVLGVLVFGATSLADDFPVPHLAEITSGGISGSLVICGGGTLPEAVIKRFVELAGGEQGRLVFISTAADNPDALDSTEIETDWHERGIPHVEVLHTTDRNQANTEDFVAPLKTATAVWFRGGQQSRLADAYVGTRVERELAELLKRGGVIGGTSAGAAIQSRLMIAFGNPEATVMQGLDLLPGAVIDQHFRQRDRQQRLATVLNDHPGHFGIGVDEGTAAIVQGRSIKILGDAMATICLAKSEKRPAKTYELKSGERADLTALRKAAIIRAGEMFPPSKYPEPNVPEGSLLIVGGGRLTPGVWKEFVNLAGGEGAKIVIVPTASERPSRGNEYTIKALKEAGAGEVTVLHTVDRTEADRTEFAEPLRTATGVWFGGGRQWRIVDAYAGTKTYDAFHEVLKRGGVIGGSSAGATIQGDYLARGNPLGNQDISAEGYEQGFAFLPGVAIDQHFTQRKRLPDLQGLIQDIPQLLGIGIDESTALVVQGNTARVLGENDVSFIHHS